MGENASNGDTGHDVQVQVQVQSSSSSAARAPVTQEDRALEDGHREKNTDNASDNGNANAHDENNLLSRSPLHRVYDILTWTPPRCRWDPKNPPRLTMPLNLLFGFACTFTVRPPPRCHVIPYAVAADIFRSPISTTAIRSSMSSPMPSTSVRNVSPSSPRSRRLATPRDCSSCAPWAIWSSADRSSSSWHGSQLPSAWACV